MGCVDGVKFLVSIYSSSQSWFFIVGKNLIRSLITIIYQLKSLAIISHHRRRLHVTIYSVSRSRVVGAPCSSIFQAPVARFSSARVECSWAMCSRLVCLASEARQTSYDPTRAEPACLCGKLTWVTCFESLSEIQTWLRGTSWASAAQLIYLRRETHKLWNCCWGMLIKQTLRLGSDLNGIRYAWLGSRPCWSRRQWCV